MKLLKALYTINSPSGAEGAMRTFITSWLDKKKISWSTDKEGNIYAVKGKAKSYPCVVAHMDEVHVENEHKKVIYEDRIMFAMDMKTLKTTGIGADDKNGIWICLKLLATQPAIKCAFFIKEEVGCIGSDAADMSFFENCRFVLECDRRGSEDLITKIGVVELCSPEFIQVLPLNEFGYKITNGMMTDIMALKNKNLGLSCVNISCGYYYPHTAQEITYLPHLLNCLNFVKAIIEKTQDVYPHVYTPKPFTPTYLSGEPTSPGYLYDDELLWEQAWEAYDKSINAACWKELL